MSKLLLSRWGLRRGKKGDPLSPYEPMLLSRALLNDSSKRERCGLALATLLFSLRNHKAVFNISPWFSPFPKCRGEEPLKLFGAACRRQKLGPPSMPTPCTVVYRTVTEQLHPVTRFCWVT